MELAVREEFLCLGVGLTLKGIGGQVLLGNHELGFFCLMEIQSVILFTDKFAVF